MEQFERPRHAVQRDSEEACATCGMVLTLPGLLHEARRYCCTGCVPARTPSGRTAGLLRPPNESLAVGCTRCVFVARPPNEVARFLADIDLLHLYEQKLARIQITAVARNGAAACATADGHFGPVLYHIELHFEALDGGGYDSTACGAGPVAGLRGTFGVTAAQGGCVVTHTESYEFRGGTAAARLGRAAIPYLGWSMARELRTLKRLVEDPAALAEAVRMRDPRQIPVDPRVVVWDPDRADSGRRGLFARVPTPQTAAVVGALGVGAVLGVAISRLASRLRT